MPTRLFEAIIFDHDGTLVDTETPDFLACQTLCREHGAELSLDYWAATIVGGFDGYDRMFAEIIQPHNGRVSTTQLKQRLRELWTVNLANTALMPGVLPLLRQLQGSGYPLAVATAADRFWVDRWLTHFELYPFFHSISCQNDVLNNKPAPDVYLHAADRLGVDPSRCLVFEDTLIGVRAAKAAGMTVIGVPSHVTKTLDFSEAHAVVSSLAHVDLKWIENVKTA
ncbi:MAG TPA: HAD family phosphatase [Anaerolineae bacterium]|nr:HAD family phosphatase [Anaerolineae bacterium]